MGHDWETMGLRRGMRVPWQETAGCLRIIDIFCIYLKGKSRMVTRFRRDTLKLVSEPEFGLVAKESLVEMLGESLASTILSSIGSDSLEDPKIFEERLGNLLGRAADRIIEHIGKNLVLRSLENLSKGRDN